MADPKSVSRSGNPDIDGLLTGYQWNDTHLSFSFPSSGWPYVTEQLGDLASPVTIAKFIALSSIPFVGQALALEAVASVVTVSGLALNGFHKFNPAQQDSARRALRQFEGISNLTFTESGDNAFGNHATLRYAETKTTSAPAFGIPPLPRVATLLGHGVLGDAWFKSDGQFDHPLLGNFADFTILHETGHILGLKHGHESGLFGERVLASPGRRTHRRQRSHAA